MGIRALAWTAILAVTTGTCTVSADCLYPKRPPTADTEPEEAAAREALFHEWCGAAPDSSLVDLEDRRFGDRLTPPRQHVGDGAVQVSSFPSRASRNMTVRNPVVALVIETNGRVRLVRLLRTSGSPSVDESAVRAFTNSRYRVPAMLDGKPVRAFHSVRIRFIETDD